jgi:tRNA (guanine-N7-)-methyltransferase
MPTGDERPARAFFGRRKGKALRPGRQQALETIVPALRLDLAAPAPAELGALFPVPVAEVRLEIGFGGGEHLLHQARENPGTGFIGVEPFESGLAKAAAAIGREAIRNIRLFDDDAVLVLDWLPPESIARVDLLFPDPWPKKRHWKRRFVNAANLDRIARVLRADGTFRFATDIESYVEWTREAVLRNGKLTLVGRGAAYLTFRKA